MVLKGLTRAGIGPVGDVESFAVLAHKYGFDAIDCSGKELQDLIQGKGVDGAKEFLGSHGLTIGSIGLSVEWRQSEETFREGLMGLAAEANAAAALGCTSCCTYVLPSTDLNPAEFLATATRRLRLCAQVLGAYGVRLGLEYVGPHHLRNMGKHPFIWDLPGTLEWIDVIHEPNVGLNLDAIHWYTTSNDPAEILSLKKDQVVHVHINDVPDVPIPEVLDNGRTFPGEGVINLSAFLRALGAIGYAGVVSQEILTKEPFEASPEELLQRSADGFNKVFTAAGL